VVQEERSLDRESGSLPDAEAFCVFATNILKEGYKQCVLRCVDIVSNKTRNSRDEIAKRDDAAICQIRLFDHPLFNPTN